MRPPHGHRLTAELDGPFRMCECGVGIATDPRDELKVYRRHRLHLEAVEHVSRDRHPAFGGRDRHPAFGGRDAVVWWAERAPRRRHEANCDICARRPR